MLFSVSEYFSNVFNKSNSIRLFFLTEQLSVPNPNKQSAKGSFVLVWAAREGPAEGGASGPLTSDSLVVWFVNRELGVLARHTKRALQYRVEALERGYTTDM